MSYNGAAIIGASSHPPVPFPPQHTPRDLSVTPRFAASKRRAAAARTSPRDRGLCPFRQCMRLRATCPVPPVQHRAGAILQNRWDL